MAAIDPTRVRRPALLVLSSTYPRWGGDVEPGFVASLCRALASEFDVHVLAPFSPGSLSVEEQGGIVVHRFHYAPGALSNLAGGGGGMLARIRGNPLWLAVVPLFLIAEIVSLRRLLRRHRFRAIHAHWIIPQGLAAVVGRIGLSDSPPIVCTLHGGDLYALRGRMFDRLRCAVARRCAVVTVVSRAMQRRIVNGCTFSTPVRVIPMGTDLRSRFRPEAESERGDCTLLFVGRLVEKKGVMHLLQALGLLVQTRPALELIIVGSGPEEPALRRLTAAIGIERHVRFAGAVANDRLPEYYRSATIAVLPFQVASGGDQEGLGLVLAEAMGCGCPVIAGDVEAVHDLVEDGRTGLLAKAGDPDDLARRIGELLDDPGRRALLAKNARSHVLERFDILASAEAFRRIFHNLGEPHG